MAGRDVVPVRLIRTEDLRRELGALSGRLAGLASEMPGAVPTEDQVWPIYAGTEKAVAKLKLRLDVERPGVFQEIPASKKPEELLTFALERMNHGVAMMDEGRLLESLQSLRESRNYLRGYLAEKRKVRMRERRQAAVSRRTSQGPG